MHVTIRVLGAIGLEKDVGVSLLASDFAPGWESVCCIHVVI
jgi:hypothetical protein